MPSSFKILRVTVTAMMLKLTGVADAYCTRYMLGTRAKGDVDTGSNHVAFRCV